MAVLSSIDGKFYEIPDDVAQRYEVAADKVKDVLAKVDPQLAEGGPDGTQPYGAAPTVVIHVSGDGVHMEEPEGAEGGVEPYWGYGYRRRYYKPYYGHHHHHHGWWGRRYYKRYYW